MSFWKTLFCSAMAVAAFSACSDDDTNDGGYEGIPEITVDGGGSATIAGSLAGGKIEQSVEVVSKGDWTLSFDKADDQTWCTPSALSGKTGTTQLSFTLAAAETERQASITLTATGYVEGIPVTKKASITVKQNEGGTTTVETNVKEIRDRLDFPEDNASGTANAKEITESMVITGIVVSDYVGNNINNHQIMLTDDTTEPGAGLMIRFKGYVGDKDTDYHLTRGSIVSFDLKGGFSKSYYDTYQVQFEADPDIEILDASDNTPEAIEVSDPAKLIDYQSQYVKVYSQPIESIRGEMYYNVSSGYANQTFETKNGSTFQLSFNSYSSSWANSIEIPAKAGYIKGCVSINQGAGNISPRNASDLEGMTEDLFTVSTEYTKTTIDQLGEGNYEIEDATIVGVHQKAVMFAQENSGTVNYVLAFENNWQDQTANPYIGAVGKTATVKGESALRYGLYQFSNFEVTTGGDSSLALPEPETFDAEAIEKYASEIKADESKAAYKYVKVSGILGIEKGASYNTYTLEIPGLTTVETVAFAYGLDSYFEGLESGDVVDATGFALGYDTSNSKLNILLREIDANTTTPAVTFTKEPEPFAATDPQQQTLPYVVANVAASEVTFEIVGTNADKFTVVSHTDKDVVVNAAGNNETDAAYTATLVAKVGGETLASVDLKQAAPVSGDGYTLISSLADLTAGELYLAGMIESYNDITYAPYSYHIWVGTISSNKDLETVNYQYESNQLTLNPNLSDRDKEKGTAAFITVEAVSGKTNTYYIKSGGKYLKNLKEATNRSMGLVDTPDGAEWLFEDNGEKGIKISNNGVYLGTAGATYDLLRSYKSESTLKWGVCFFKKNK